MIVVHILVILVRIRCIGSDFLELSAAGLFRRAGMVGLFVYVASVAIHTLSGCVPVDDDLLVPDRAGLQVTFGARHVGMATGQREMRAGVVVEPRGYPALGMVAIRTVRLTIFSQELLIVGIVVAGFALARCAAETRLRSVRRQLVAIRACHRPVCAS